MSTAPESTGSTTLNAAVPATAHTGPPTVAAPATIPQQTVAYSAPSRKQKDFTIRAPPTSSGPKNPGLSMLLSGVSDLPFNGIKYNTPTYIIPCLIQFYYVLSVMDNQMVHTKRFTDANADWHPFVSQLYFAILTFYVVLRNQRIAAQISHEQNLFLEFLDNAFKADHLKVPGPLVIFFQSLAANVGPNENYGRVVYGIPNNPGLTQANEFRFANRLNLHLPNPIFILDQFMRIINDIAPVGAVPGAVTQAMTDRAYMSIYGTAAANAAVNRSCMLTPSARSDLQVTVNVLANLISSSNVWRNSLPFDPATNASTYVAGANAAALTLDQILGFRGFGATVTRNFDWFAQCSRIMQTYSDFFKDSVSLGSISSTGLGINYIRTEYLNSLANADTLLHDVITRDVRFQAPGTARYAIEAYHDIATRSVHSEEYLDSVTEQAGSMTQLNVDWTALNANIGSVNQGPLRGNVIIGPLEDRVDLRRTAWVVVSNTIPPIVTGYYHSPVALKFE